MTVQTRTGGNPEVQSRSESVVTHFGFVAPGFTGCGKTRPPRKRGSTSVQKELNSRFRGNDRQGVIFDGAEL
jgi:hypothetical protein